MVTKSNEPISIQGFPARPLVRPTDGAWLTVYRSELFEYINKQKTPKRRKKPKKYFPLTDDFLTSKIGMVDPSLTKSINVASSSLGSVDTSIELFRHLSQIDASDNNLGLEEFAAFPNLTELNITLNNIRTVSLPNCDCFSKLTTLNLSFNNITDGKTVSELAGLKELKILNLDGNDCLDWPQYLKPNFEFERWFPKLEILSLEGNKINNSDIFTCLAFIKNLTSLNLKNNKITEIPPIQVIEDTVHHQITENLETCLNEDIVEMLLDKEKINSFANLHELNISSNHIEDEESVLSLCLIPGIRRIIFENNPFEYLSSEHGVVADNFFKGKNIEFIRSNTKKKAGGISGNVRKVAKTRVDRELGEFKMGRVVGRRIAEISRKYENKKNISRFSKVEQVGGGGEGGIGKIEDFLPDDDCGTTFTTQIGETENFEDHCEIREDVGGGRKCGRHLKEILDNSKFSPKSTIDEMYEYAYSTSKRGERVGKVTQVRVPYTPGVRDFYCENLKVSLNSVKPYRVKAKEEYLRFKKVYEDQKKN